MSEAVAHRPVVIVGGGAAGAAAALGFSGTIPLMLDVGFRGKPSPLDPEPVADLLSAARSSVDTSVLDDVLIGHDFQSVLRSSERNLSIKLKAPYVRFITDRPSGMPADEHAGCTTTQSFAIGGLANAWGAGAMRYTEAELRYFPFPFSELQAGFDFLTQHIGISGAATDDLADYFGSAEGLLPELPLCELCSRFLDRYKHNNVLLRRRGLKVGRPRLAVLSTNHRGRTAFTAIGQEYFLAPHEGIYTPAFTIKELIGRGKLEYRSGIQVETFECVGDRVLVHARDVETASKIQFTTAHLVLAAGTLNTARILLASRHDHSTRLPLLDNPVTLLPFIDVGRIGHPLRPKSFLGAELILVLESPLTFLPIQGSIYNLMGPFRTDLVREFPLSFSGNLAAARYLAPAMLMLQLFFPDDATRAGHVQLLPSGGLHISRISPRLPSAVHTVVQALRAMGYATSSLLARHLLAGSSIHYAGTIPARLQPLGPFETDRDCRLPWAPRVYIADASTFPILPAKNHTLMMMANALRIGRLIEHPRTSCL